MGGKIFFGWKIVGREGTSKKARWSSAGGSIACFPTRLAPVLSPTVCFFDKSGVAVKVAAFCFRSASKVVYNCTTRGKISRQIRGSISIVDPTYDTLCIFERYANRLQIQSVESMPRILGRIVWVESCFLTSIYDALNVNVCEWFMIIPLGLILVQGF